MSFALSVPFRQFGLKASTSMPYSGDFSAVDTGELIPFTLDFASIIGADPIAQCAGAVVAYYGVDPNAAFIPLLAATFSGTKVSQWLGTAFVPGVIYQWDASIVTASSAAYTAFGRFLCANPRAPSSIAPSPPDAPGTVFSITTNHAITQPGVYVLKATGITITLPTTWTFLQGFIIMDGTLANNPNQTINGPAIGGSFVAGTSVFVNPGQSNTFAWDSDDSQFLAF